MKPLVLCSLLALAFSTLSAADDSNFPLKDIGPSVEAILSAENIDETELAYVSARGAALFMAISKWLDENPGGDRDKQLSEKMLHLAHPFFVAAHFFGERTGKSGKNTDAQIVALIDTYIREMIRSKQLNNEILSIPVSRDMKALQKIAPLVNGLVKSLEASEKAPSEEKEPKP